MPGNEIYHSGRQDGGIRRVDTSPPETRQRITPDDFVADGNSLAAREFAQSWREALIEGDLAALFACSDARVVYNPKNTIGFRSISATVPNELHGRGNVLSREFGTRLAVVMTHYSDSLPRFRARGCGGADEKAAMRSGGIEGIDVEREGAARFVNRHVIHEDPLITASYSTIKIAEQSGLPVLGTAQDHTTGKLVVLNAAMPTSRGGIEIISTFSLSELIEGQYNEQEIYANGIPALEEDRIPDEFSPFLIRHQTYVDDLKRRHPNFHETQLVQNPDIVLLTSVIRPSRGRLPRTSGASANRVFAITVARNPDDRSRDVDDKSMQNASDELAYPLGKALQSGGDASLPFSSLHGKGTVILETRSLDRSRRLAAELSRKPWFEEWASVPENQIMVAQTTQGLVDHAELYPVA